MVQNVLVGRSGFFFLWLFFIHKYGVWELSRTTSCRTTSDRVHWMLGHWWWWARFLEPHKIVLEMKKKKKKKKKRNTAETTGAKTPCGEKTDLLLWCSVSFDCTCMCHNVDSALCNSQIVSSMIIAKEIILRLLLSTVQVLLRWLHGISRRQTSRRLSNCCIVACWSPRKQSNCLVGL